MSIDIKDYRPVIFFLIAGAVFSIFFSLINRGTFLWFLLRVFISIIISGVIGVIVVYIFNRFLKIDEDEEAYDDLNRERAKGDNLDYVADDELSLDDDILNVDDGVELSIDNEEFNDDFNENIAKDIVDEDISSFSSSEDDYSYKSIEETNDLIAKEFSEFDNGDVSSLDLTDKSVVKNIRTANNDDVERLKRSVESPDLYSKAVQTVLRREKGE